MAKKRKAKAKRRAQEFIPIPKAFFKAATFAVAQLSAGRIVQEIVDEMNLTVAAVGKSFQPGAIDEWRGKLLVAVIMKLAQPGANWPAARVNVLAVAHDMALIAALLSGPMPAISKPRVHAAFRACKDHQTCPTPSGSGAWCNFDV